MNSPLPFVCRGAKAWGMARRHSPRHPLFRQRWFADDIIITCVRWYLGFKLSYRDLAELVRELGVCVAPSTILRWVIRYVPEFEKCWQAHERPVGDSWRGGRDLPQGRRSHQHRNAWAVSCAWPLYNASKS